MKRLLAALLVVPYAGPADFPVLNLVTEQRAACTVTVLLVAKHKVIGKKGAALLVEKERCYSLWRLRKESSLAAQAAPVTKRPEVAATAKPPLETKQVAVEPRASGQIAEIKGTPPKDWALRAVLERAWQLGKSPS